MKKSLKKFLPHPSKFAPRKKKSLSLYENSIYETEGYTFSANEMS